jgi:hypothetical protein
MTDFILLQDTEDSDGVKTRVNVASIVTYCAKSEVSFGSGGTVVSLGAKDIVVRETANEIDQLIKNKLIGVGPEMIRSPA